MVRHFCDFCGKETKDLGRVRIKIEQILSPKPPFSIIEEKDFEVCWACAEVVLSSRNK